MRHRTHLLRWIAVLAVAASVAAPSGAWAEENRGRGARGGSEVELRHHDDDPAMAETEDVNDDRGDDRAAQPAAAQTPAPAASVPAPATATATQALSVVEGASAQAWTYAPALLTISVGTTLTWTNTGAQDHTVTSDDRTTFDSHNLAPDATFSFSATAAGTFAYHCAYHPWMNGTITVTP